MPSRTQVLANATRAFDATMAIYVYLRFRSVSRSAFNAYGTRTIKLIINSTDLQKILPGILFITGGRREQFNTGGVTNYTFDPRIYLAYAVSKR